jgi:hypothetical protein
MLILMSIPGMAESTNEGRVASALAGKFETVFYTDARLLDGTGPFHGLSKQDSDALRVPFAHLLGGLDALGEQAAREIPSSAQAVLVGVKDFRAPSGLGSVRSRFCYVLTLKDSIEIGKYFRQAPTATFGSASVWEWSANLGEYGEADQRPSLLYVAQLANSYVIVSNSLSDLEPLVKLLQTSEAVAADSLWAREWELVRRFPVWGYRRYRHFEVHDKLAAGTSEISSDAEALLFFADPEKKHCSIRLLSSSPDDTTAAKINEKASLPPLKPIAGAKGIWTTTIPLIGDEESYERMFVVMGLFGFAIYA